MVQFQYNPSHNPRTQTINKNAYSGEFLNGKASIIASGPPCLDFDVDSGEFIIQVYPIGLAQSFGLGVTNPINRISEIGSQKWYFVRDREVWGLSMQHAMLDRGSLSKLLYSYYLVYDADKDQLTDTIDPTKYPGGQAPPDAPNSGGHFLKLGSSFFEYPFGLHLNMMNSVYRDGGGMGESFSQWYIEDVYIQNINFGISAGSALIMESLGFMVGDVKPIPIASINYRAGVCVLGSEA